MISFVTPALLWLSGAVALAGGAALWRGRRRVQAISSVKLWEGLAGPAEARCRRRVVDPLWLLIFLAGLLAALALAGPRWRVGHEVGTIDAEFALRGTRAGDVPVLEAWVRAADARAGSYAFLMNGAVLRQVAADELRRGKALPVTVASDRVTLGLRAEDGAETSREFTRPDDAMPFALLSETAPGSAIDSKLMQLFRLLPGARQDDFTVTPSVVLVNAPALTADDPAISNGTLIVAQPQTPMPGIVLGDVVHAPAGGWAVERGSAADSLPAFVSFTDVHAMELREATFSPEWQPLAMAGGKPWIMQRQMRDAHGIPQTWIWLASDPSTQSNWPSVPTFVLFFTDLTTRSLAAAGPSKIEAWHSEPIAPRTGTPSPSYDLQPVFGGTAIVLLLLATCWFLSRSRMPAGT